MLPDGETSAIGCNTEVNEIVKRVIIVFKIIVNRGCRVRRVTDVRRRGRCHVTDVRRRRMRRVTDVRRRRMRRVTDVRRRRMRRVTDCIVGLHWRRRRMRRVTDCIVGLH